MYEGGNCDVDIDECLSIPCQNNGACSEDGINAYACDCQYGWAGTNCDQQIDACYEEENDCSKYAYCTHTGPGLHSCTCQPGYDEQPGTAVVDRAGRGEPQVCVDTDECVDGACDNDALCLQSSDNVFPAVPRGQYRCVCRPGFANGHC